MATFLQRPVGISYAPNIAPPASASGATRIKTAITTGVRLKPPMGYHYYKGIRASDLDAIVAYLRTLKRL